MEQSILNRVSWKLDSPDRDINIGVYNPPWFIYIYIILCNHESSSNKGFEWIYAPGLPPFLSHPASNPTSSFQWGSRPKERSLEKTEPLDNRELYQDIEYCIGRRPHGPDHPANFIRISRFVPCENKKYKKKHNEQVSSIYCREWWTKSTKE